MRGVGFVRGTNSALAKVPTGSTTSELMHSVDWLPTLVLLGGGSIASTRPLDGFDVWDVISKGAKAKRQIIAHNVPKRGYAGAFRLGPHKIILLGPVLVLASWHGVQDRGCQADPATRIRTRDARRDPGDIYLPSRGL